MVTLSPSSALSGALISAAEEACAPCAPSNKEASTWRRRLRSRMSFISRAAPGLRRRVGFKVHLVEWGELHDVRDRQPFALLRCLHLLTRVGTRVSTRSHGSGPNHVETLLPDHVETPLQRPPPRAFWNQRPAPPMPLTFSNPLLTPRLTVFSLAFTTFPRRLHNTAQMPLPHSARAYDTLLPRFHDTTPTPPFHP